MFAHMDALQHTDAWSSSFKREEAKVISFGSQSFLKNNNKKKQPYLKTPELIRWITDLQNSMQFQFYQANFKTIGSLVQTWGHFPFAIIAAHSLNPNSSPLEKKKEKQKTLV